MAGLPEFKGVNKSGAAPTIRDLMTHTSGMMGNPQPAMADFYQKMDRTLAEAVSLYAQKPLEFEPGTRWMYSNTGIATLGRIIEVKSGKPYEEFIAEHIFKPLGMKDSFYFAPESKRDRVAMVYTRDTVLHRAPGTILGGDPANYRNGAKYPAPEFGLYSTAADLNLFYQAMLNGKLLSKESMRVMTMNHTGDIKAGWLKDDGYGLGWEVVKEPLGMLTLMSPWRISPRGSVRNIRLGRHAEEVDGGVSGADIRPGRGSGTGCLYSDGECAL